MQYPPAMNLHHHTAKSARFHPYGYVGLLPTAIELENLDEVTADAVVNENPSVTSKM
jgi:hypothetical protein